VTGTMILTLELYEKPISDADPCGEPLDYDLDFLELEMAARGQPSQELGSSTVAAIPPDWTEVNRLATELSTRSKDLRIAILAAQSALALEGLAGLARGLEGLAILIERYWTDLHPRPDAEDGGDDTVRANALANLCDPEGILRQVRQLPLTQSRVFGNFSLLHWLEAQRSAATGDKPVAPDVAAVENSFRDTAQDLLKSHSAELGTVLATITRIDKGARGHLGAANTICFDPLVEALQQMKHVVDEHLLVVEAECPTVTKGAAEAPAPSEEIRDRNDVVGLLDRICRWYRTNEPASPVPVLLERVKRVVAKDFMALLVELAPGGAAQFRALAGLTEGD